MTHPTKHRGADAVIQSEIEEATALAEKHRSFAGIIRLNFWAAVLATVIFTLDIFVAPPGDLEFVAFLLAWTGFNGWALRKLRRTADNLDEVVEERRAALIAAGDT